MIVLVAIKKHMRSIFSPEGVEAGGTRCVRLNGVCFFFLFLFFLTSMRVRRLVQLRGGSVESVSRGAKRR